MIEILSNPLLGDYIQVCAQMPPDERAQLEAFSGEPYDIDGAAIGNFTAPGPKWCARIDGRPVAVGGFVYQRPGVYRDFLISTPEAWAVWFQVTRACRRVMDALLLDERVHRLECVAPAVRLSSRPEIERWYRVLGYQREAVLRRYCADGGDAIMFSRVTTDGHE
jgi:hypothetical protein